MRVPIDWLKEYIKVEKSAAKIAEDLTMLGLEVESITEGKTGPVLEIELTPNRGDCASIIGVARELSVKYKYEMKYPHTKVSSSEDKMGNGYQLEIENNKCCPFYSVKLIEYVNVAKSSRWLRKRLEDCGIRPLNNAVDVCNYIMVETGQPLHAFDAEKIKGNKISVRKADGGEELLFLDKQKRKLNKDDIVIADGEGPLALAGVMGGLDSAVSENTEKVLLESAFFNPKNISRTQKRMGLNTEASYRFSRNVDPKWVLPSLYRAANMLKQECQGKPIPGHMNSGRVPQRKKKVSITADKVNGILGTHLSTREIKKYLNLLEFDISSEEDSKITLQVPSHRSDVEREIDLIEEVARVYGYDKVESSLPETTIESELLNTSDNFSRTEEILRACGYSESVTNTLIDKNLLKNMGLLDEVTPVEISNPINVGMNILRPGLLFGLLEVARYNINQKQKSIKFYERGPVFFMRNGEYKEHKQIAFVSQGGDFYQAKKTAISMLQGIKQEYSFKYHKKSALFDKKRSAVIEIGGVKAGELGCLKEMVVSEAGLSGKKFTGCFIYLETVKPEKTSDIKFRKWSQFPSIFRDISLVAPIGLTHFDIYDTIKKAGGGCLKEVRMYDMFIDDKIGRGKKSMTFELEFNSPEKTLHSQEVDRRIGKIIEKLEKEKGISLRKK